MGKVNWALFQLAHTADFGPLSVLRNYATIGSSNQVAHHLLPGMCWIHCPAITKILQEMVEERPGILPKCYHVYDGTWDMWTGKVRQVMQRVRCKETSARKKES